MAQDNSRKKVIEQTRKAFAGPTARQLRLQAEARAKGGLTERGIRKFEQKTKQEQLKAIQKEEKKLGLEPREKIEKPKVEMQPRQLRVEPERVKKLDLPITQREDILRFDVPLPEFREQIRRIEPEFRPREIKAPEIKRELIPREIIGFPTVADDPIPEGTISTEPTDKEGEPNCSLLLMPLGTTVRPNE